MFYFTMMLFCASTCVLSALPKKTEDLPVIYTDDESPKKVPEAILIQMKELKSANDFHNFINAYAEAMSPPGTDTVRETNDTSYIGRKRPLGADVLKSIAKGAGCVPEIRAVPIESDPGIITWPDCTPLPRCGGCCPSHLLECVPRHISKVNLKVLQVRYEGTKFETLPPKMVTMDQHDNCTCECKEKKSDCGPAQLYSVQECQCFCKDKREQANCSKDKERIWDPRECACKCREVEECSTGLRFSPVKCKCELLGRRSNLATPIGRLSGSPLVRDDGGERGGRGEHYVGIRPVDDVGPFTMARSRGSTEQRRRRIKVPVSTERP